MIVVVSKWSALEGDQTTWLGCDVQVIFYFLDHMEGGTCEQ